MNPTFWPMLRSDGPLRLNDIEQIEELDEKLETIRELRKRKSVQITSIFDLEGGYFHLSVSFL